MLLRSRGQVAQPVVDCELIHGDPAASTTVQGRQVIGFDVRLVGHILVLAAQRLNAGQLHLLVVVVVVVIGTMLLI